LRRRKFRNSSQRTRGWPPEMEHAPRFVCRTIRVARLEAPGARVAMPPPRSHPASQTTARGDAAAESQLGNGPVLWPLENASIGAVEQSMRHSCASPSTYPSIHPRLPLLSSLAGSHLPTDTATWLMVTDLAAAGPRPRNQESARSACKEVPMTPATTTGAIPQTLNPPHWSNSPQTLNPKPQTLDPKPSAIKNQTFRPKP
jgi:hypothetical protein